MANIIRTDELANGVRIEFIDGSNRYFGDYHRLRIEVHCRIAVTEQLFADALDPAAEAVRAREILGTELLWTRALERMGVAGGGLAVVRDELIDAFVASSYPYLQSPEFPVKLAAQKLAEHKKQHRPFRLVK